MRIVPRSHLSNELPPSYGAAVGPRGKDVDTGAGGMKDSMVIGRGVLATGEPEGAIDLADLTAVMRSFGVPEAEAGKTLQSLLILPIQRLPRYKLCLSEIVKYTEPDHPDLADLKPKSSIDLVLAGESLKIRHLSEDRRGQQV